MSDRELKNILNRSKKIAEQSRKEFTKSIDNMRKAQQRIKSAI